MPNDISLLEEAIKEDLHLSDSWSKGNELSFNVAKTNSILNCAKSRQKILKNDNDKRSLLNRERELQSGDAINYLGVHVDHSLSWKDN